MPQVTELRLGARTPVCDHAGTVLFWADRNKALDLFRRHDVDHILARNSNRIKALRYLGPDPAGLSTGSHHKRPAGTPHRNETYYNVRGVWHIDRIPTEWRPLFSVKTEISVTQNAE